MVALKLSITAVKNYKGDYKMKKKQISSKEVKQELINILVPEAELKGLKQIIIKKDNKLYLFKPLKK